MLVLVINVISMLAMFIGGGLAAAEVSFGGILVAISLISWTITGGILFTYSED